jgi:thiol-disulfide isomerase/thioredoxin
MKKKTQNLYWIIFFLITSNIYCQTKKIKLDLVNNTNTFYLNELSFDLRVFDNIDKFKGIPLLDSLKIHYFAIDLPQYVYDKYKSKKYDKKKALEYFKRTNIDTLTLSQIPIEQELIILIGFKKNKQILIADCNKNNDFNDDFKYEFDLDAKIDANQLINSPFSTYKFEYFENNKIISFERKFVLVPDKHNFISQHLKKENIPYLTFVKFTDAWFAKFDNYEFYFDNIYERNSFYLKDKKMNFTEDINFNRQFEYTYKDTININNSFYTVHKKPQMDSLLLNPVKKASFKRLTIGNTIPKSHLFKDLKNNDFTFKDVLRNKDFLLLEFWGTWCGPCIKFSADIEEFYSKNENKINILGVAVDKSSEHVLEYVTKNNIKWQQTFIKLNSNNKFIKQLNIKAYPTIILINKNNEIMFLGSGTKESLKKIEKLIN